MWQLLLEVSLTEILLHKTNIFGLEWPWRQKSVAVLTWYDNNFILVTVFISRVDKWAVALHDGLTSRHSHRPSSLYDVLPWQRPTTAETVERKIHATNEAFITTTTVANNAVSTVDPPLSSADDSTPDLIAYRSIVFDSSLVNWHRRPAVAEGGFCGGSGGARPGPRGSHDPRETPVGVLLGARLGSNASSGNWESLQLHWVALNSHLCHRYLQHIARTSCEVTAARLSAPAVRNNN